MLLRWGCTMIGLLGPLARPLSRLSVARGTERCKCEMCCAAKEKSSACLALLSFFFPLALPRTSKLLLIQITHALTCRQALLLFLRKRKDVLRVYSPVVIQRVFSFPRGPVRPPCNALCLRLRVVECIQTHLGPV